MSTAKQIRVLIAKPGLDGHDKGAKIVAKGLKDAGMEVIYTGLRQSVDSILSTAIQEDVDVIGLSILSASHLSISEELMGKLREKGIDDMMVLVGGVIPKRDVEKLKAMGVAEVFRNSARIEDIASYINTRIQR